LPHEDRYAPVIALAIAASVDGTTWPSSPPVAPRPPATVTLAGAPVIWNTASTLPTRSTTATVAATPRACASPTACDITRCTRVSDRKSAGERQFGAQGGEVELLEPAQPSTTAATSARRGALARTARLRDRPRLFRIRAPRVGRVVEAVAQHAARGDLLLD